MTPPALSSRPSKQVMVRMDPEMHQAVKELAAANDRTMAQEIRRAVRRVLDSERE